MTGVFEAHPHELTVTSRVLAQRLDEALKENETLRARNRTLVARLRELRETVPTWEEQEDAW